MKRLEYSPVRDVCVKLSLAMTFQLPSDMFLEGWHKVVSALALLGRVLHPHRDGSLRQCSVRAKHTEECVLNAVAIC